MNNRTMCMDAKSHLWTVVDVCEVPDPDRGSDECLDRNGHACMYKKKDVMTRIMLYFLCALTFHLFSISELSRPAIDLLKRCTLAQCGAAICRPDRRPFIPCHSTYLRQLLNLCISYVSTLYRSV